MSSLLTNVTAMSALRSLTVTQDALAGTEDQLSTGLRVADAADDAAYWAISVGMKAQVSGLGAVQDGLNLSKSIADVTATALKSVIGTVQDIQADVVTAATPGIDTAKVQTDIAAKQNEIMSTIKSASFNGVNWLYSDTPYQLHETLTTNETYSASAATVNTILNNHSTTVSGTYDVSGTNHDVVAISGPDGFSGTIVDDATYGQAVTRVLGSRSPTFTDGPASETLSQTAPPDDDYVSGQEIPLSDGADGLVMDRTQSFNIYNPGLSIDGTRSLTRNYVGSSSTSVDHATYRFDDTPQLDAAVAAAVPGSLLTSLMSLDVTDASVTAQTRQDTVSSTLASLTTIASRVGSLRTQIGIQQTFNQALSDAITSGVGSLVDADMDIASTRLKALQTQRELAMRALSIANDNGRQVLKLLG